MTRTNATRHHPVLPIHFRQGSRYRSMAGQAEAEHVTPFRVKDLADAAQAVKRVGEAVQKQGAALDLFRNKLEGPVD